MAKTEKYLNQLKADKTALANNLVEKGIEASEDETFTELVPKVLDIPTGATPPAKGFIVNEFDSNGYATDISIVGMTTIPAYALGSYDKNYVTFLNKNLKNVHFPDNLTEIGNYAFRYCLNLSLQSLPNGITKIGQAAFAIDSLLALKSLPDELVNRYFIVVSCLIRRIPCHLFSPSNQ